MKRSLSKIEYKKFFNEIATYSSKLKLSILYIINLLISSQNPKKDIIKKAEDHIKIAKQDK